MRRHVAVDASPHLVLFSDEDFWFDRGLTPKVNGSPFAEPLCQGSGFLEPMGTIASSTFTLVLTCVGSGAFALPFAFSCAGEGVGAVLTVIIALLSFLSAHALSCCSQLTGLFTYEEIVRATCGHVGSCVGLLIVILLQGAMAALLTLIRDSVPAAIGLFVSGEIGTRLTHHQDWIVACIVTFVVIPLSCARSINALRHSNNVAVTCVFFAISYVVVRGGVVSTEHGGRPAFTDPLRAIEAVPILMASFCMHIQVPTVYGELKQRSVGRFSVVLSCQTLIVLVLYLGLGILGLRLFPPHIAVPGDVLMGLDQNDFIVLGIRASVGFSCTSVFPLLCMPCRSSLDQLLFGKCNGGTSASATSASHFGTRFYLETLGVVLIAAALSYGMRDLGRITCVTGTIGGTLLCFVIPLACFIRLHGLGMDCWRSKAQVRAIYVGLAGACMLTACSFGVLIGKLTSQ
eukprot:TRINITY_DN45133_c0_g1_i1.p1 TRINITY_DN45133_c0_g1~~TRINITY_DN45133_c0_g1_i1.p1  ORF type:complete len:459 (+),score=27.37 TRINITY_DN45133_c0_g1_i1:64-1440(+)